ncbi:hypothetical protein ACIQUM_03965 [Amycolatopsis azurea]|uniref:hypothetical protein n=1 Tax=Amycolatopsis azurea TaxID=36819 RepID=UPI00382EEE0A
MTDDLGLPGRRELPPEVLDNLRMSLREGMGKPVRRRWPIVAAAAAVVGVLAGALVTAVLIREPDGTGPVVANPDFSLDWPKAVKSMDRCWAAIQAQGRAASFPARAGWEPQFTVVGEAAVTVVAVMVGDKPFFCETTRTSATVSDPDDKPIYTDGGKTAALLMTDGGTVAGVADPSWPKVEITGQNESASPFRDLPIFRRGNLFVYLGRMKPARTAYSVGPTPGEQSRQVPYQAPYLLPQASLPAASVIDRPEKPERESTAGAFFKVCTEGAFEAVPDVDAYRAGALLERDDVAVVLARLGDEVVVCQGGVGYQDGKSAFYRAFPQRLDPPSSIGPLRTETVGNVDRNGNEVKPRNSYTGTVPEAAAAVKLDFGTGATVDATVSNGTFAAWVPDGVSQDIENARVAITVLDGAGKVLHQGTLRLY